MIVQHNLAAMNTNRQLGITETNQSKSTEKLSSGYRINRAGDDAAGLTISEKMRSQVRGLNQASANAQDGISMIQVAEGALNETHSILQRMNELAVKAVNGTNTSVDQAAVQKEINALASEISRIASQTQFNKKVLLDGKLGTVNLQVGANAGETIGFSIAAMGATNLSVNALSISSSASITSIQNAIAQVSNQRSALGAVQNRLEHTIANLDVASENTQAAESRIRDVDMANEMVEFSKNNILAQAGQAMLAQANQSTQGVLSLL